MEKNNSKLTCTFGPVVMFISSATSTFSLASADDIRCDVFFDINEFDSLRRTLHFVGDVDFFGEF